MTRRRELANAIRPLSSEPAPGRRGRRAPELVALRRQLGTCRGFERFGASGKGADVFPHFGFTADNIVQQIREPLEGA
ncbi:MAG TPA: hypothetical protein VL220_01535 [Steroidobacteraceae bacterium]|jgi:hypothetical protein|nr:hypothetical protein [Steroidobacteraceae bacterium]